jgi:hypothetical protein
VADAAAGPAAPQVLGLDTVEGPARVHLHHATNGGPARGLLLLGHGAGGGIGAADLQAMVPLRDQGWDVGLVEQPWRVAGRRVATPPPRLDAAWRDLVPALLSRHPADRLVVGGRSAGGRVACRTAPGDPAIGLPRATGVLCLAFPLHPPGRPERSRAEELRTPPAHGIPVLVVQGDRDPFGAPDEVRAALGPEPGPVQVHPVRGTHSPTGGLVGLRSAVATWLDGLP